MKIGIGKVEKKHLKILVQLQMVYAIKFSIYLSVIKAGKLLKNMSHMDSIIIIGAGLSGLTAADEILTASPQCQVTILEAMNAPGGRTRTITVNGTKYDMGAEWVGPPQKFVQELAKRANNLLIEQNPVGRRILEMGNNMEAYSSNLPQNFGEAEGRELEEIIQKIEAMAKTVPRDFPQKCPNSIQWDSLTAHSWIELNIKHEKVKRFLELLVRTNYGCETNEVSFLFFLLYVHQNHGLACMMNTVEGLQAYKFAKGTQPLSFYLEKEIRGKGASIYYNSFVNKVVQTQKEVIVSTRNGITYRAKYLIMAGPPQMTRKIQFEPQLSRERRFIADRFIMAAFSKMVLIYDKRYWLEKGFSGEILSDCHDAPVLNAYDETRPNEKGELQPAIVILLAATIEEEWQRNREQLKRKTIEKLAKFYESPEMMNPIRVELKIWNQQESVGGAPTAFTPPGVLSKIHNIREPEGRIHWAGTETALISQGYMDGAIESGIRVSKEILQRFKANSPVKREVRQLNTKRYTQYHLSNKSMYSRL